MKFRYDVIINDQDYLDYNTFWVLKSPYGKKQIKTFRLAIAVMFFIFFLISLSLGKFTPDSFLGIIPMAILFVLFQTFLSKFFKWILKGQIKSLKNSGKMGYSPNSVIEFGEESFTETTPENKTEHKYSAVERVSVIENKIIYIHVNNVMSYLIPFSCFQTNSQYNEFLNFIKTKCVNVDFY